MRSLASGLLNRARVADDRSESESDEEEQDVDLEELSEEDLTDSDAEQSLEHEERNLKEGN